MTELMGRMKTMERKLKEQQQAIANSKSHASSRLNSFNRGSFGRGYQK